MLHKLNKRRTESCLSLIVYQTKTHYFKYEYYFRFSATRWVTVKFVLPPLNISGTLWSPHTGIWHISKRLMRSASKLKQNKDKARQRLRFWQNKRSDIGGVTMLYTLRYGNSSSIMMTSPEQLAWQRPGDRSNKVKPLDVQP